MLYCLPNGVTWEKRHERFGVDFHPLFRFESPSGHALANPARLRYNGMGAMRKTHTVCGNAAR